MDTAMPCIRRTSRILATLLALPIAAVAAGSSFQPAESIQQAAMAAVPGAGSSGVEIEAVVDSALRLPACTTSLQAQPASSGTIEVVCPGNTGWRLYVPVRVRRVQEVLVLQRPLMPGELLTGDALALESRDVGRVVGALVDPNAVLGYRLRRPLAAGTVLTAADVQSPRLVRRGDSVVVVARAGGIEVRTSGKALGDAGAGERVNVENLSSRRMLQGVVRPGGEVEVGI